MLSWSGQHEVSTERFSEFFIFVWPICFFLLELGTFESNVVLAVCFIDARHHKPSPGLTWQQTEMQRAAACCFVDVCIKVTTVQPEMQRASISRSPEATVDRQAGQLSMCTQTCTPMQSLAHIWHVCIFGHIWHMYKAADQTSILTTLVLHHIWFLCLHRDKKYSTEHILTENVYSQCFTWYLVVDGQLS